MSPPFHHAVRVTFVEHNVFIGFSLGLPKQLLSFLRIAGNFFASTIKSWKWHVHGTITDKRSRNVLCVLIADWQYCNKTDSDILIYRIPSLYFTEYSIYRLYSSISHIKAYHIISNNVSTSCICYTTIDLFAAIECISNSQLIIICTSYQHFLPQ